MKIAVALDESDENSEISFRGGRAGYSLVFENGRLSEVLKNPFAISGGGVGFGVAYMLADKGVELVIAGRFGSDMEAALKERHLDFEEMQGVIKDVIKKITSI